MIHLVKSQIVVNFENRNSGYGNPGFYLKRYNYEILRQDRRDSDSSQNTRERERERIIYGCHRTAKDRENIACAKGIRGYAYSIFLRWT